MDQEKEQKPIESADGEKVPYARHDEDAVLDPYHAEYLLKRHGTIELDPLPSADPRDPLNWAAWRKNLYLVIFAFHGMMAGFLAAGLLPATSLMAEAYGRSLAAVTYLISISIAIYGITPFLWLPVMERVGRRPCLLVSVFGATVCNIGGIFCKTYGQQMATRCLTAFFISPPCALGSIVITELFFRHERGTKTGIWKLFWTVGAPAGPFIMGFVTKYAGLRWTYGMFALITFTIFLAYVFFGPETMYQRKHHDRSRCGRDDVTWLSSMSFHSIDHKPWSLRDAVRPLKIFASIRIIAPICAYAIIFAYGNIAIVITMPQVGGEKFHLDAEGVGLQFIAVIIGLVLGEIVGGVGSDFWIQWRTSKRSGNDRVIEDRLWLAYPGIFLVVAGLIIWGVRTQQATPGHWIVSPDVGAAIASVGCQVLTTVLVTYVIDVNPNRAADTGLIVNLVRQEWGFLGPFYFPDMFATLGFGGAGGVMAAIVGVVAGTLVLLIHFTNIGVGARHTIQSQSTVNAMD